MIRTLLALDGALARGALAFVLTREPDIDVVAEVEKPEELHPMLCVWRPDVAVVDSDMFDTDRHATALVARELSCPTLILLAARRAPLLSSVLRTANRSLGFLGNDVDPERVVDAVRRLHGGEPVLDADLVVAALEVASPLTVREAEVLQIASEGWPVVDIADKLGISPGTVRNHLSRIMTKTGARTRIEAVRIARREGWI